MGGGEKTATKEEKAATFEIINDILEMPLQKILSPTLWARRQGGKSAKIPRLSKDGRSESLFSDVHSKRTAENLRAFTASS